MKKPSEPPIETAQMPVRAFVLAGARASGDPLAEKHGVPSKAHIRVAGVSMLGRVLAAVRSSDQVGDISVIGLDPDEALQRKEAWPAFDTVQGANGPSASVALALSQIEQQGPVLITTCDHALLTSEIVDTFLTKSSSTPADLTVALARRADIEARYPGVSRTYLRFGDDAYSSCNLFCLKTPEANKVVEFWQSAEADRKRPWRIALRFGVWGALRLLIKRPSVEDAFAIISKRLGVQVGSVILPFADAAVDVDTDDDLALVERVLSERRP